MVNINAISNVNPTTPPPMTDPCCSLTAEGLLLYCQTQLGSLDNEIQSYIDRQKLALKKKELLTDIQNAMKAGEGTDATWDRIAKAFDDAIAALPEGDPLRAELAAQKYQIWDDYGEGNGPPNKGRGPTNDEWKVEMDEVAAMYESVKGNAELEMIQVQSLMSARQTAVQLTTGMLAKVDQMQMAVIKNI